ncbi:MAG: S41 family peptidase [Firmicutes bacterium]|nr:S41 family peptidase [Bacillota bacterium]
MNNRKSFVVGLLVGVVLMVLFTTGYDFYYRQMRWGGGISPNEKVEEIYSLINRYFILPFDRDEMIENMYRGLVAGVGDPYTQYFCLQALEAFRVRTEGTFVGIGVRVYMDPDDRLLTLASVFRDSPAGKAGLMPGDKIIGVDGIDVAGRSQPEIMGLIAGEEGTNVNIEIFRPYENTRFNVDIIRARVIVPTVFHEMIETDGRLTGYIRIEAFERPTYSQFTAALTELIDSGMDSLIIDVRNNPGGLLDIVVDIANRLVPEGIITYVENVDGFREYHNSNSTYLGMPLVILINERSASASEVLAGAVQDTGVGALVGQQTFGKGIVQNLRNLSDGTAIKLTVAKYFTPNGTSIHGVGLQPDFVIEMDENLSRRIGDLPIEEDVQLQVGLRMVLRK